MNRDIEQLVRAFLLQGGKYPPQVIERGIEYAQQNRVHDYIGESDQGEVDGVRLIHGWVQGHNRYTVQGVFVLPEDNPPVEDAYFENDCTCPQKQNCKHGVALMCELLDGDPDYSRRVWSYLKSPLPATAPTLNGEFSSWMQTMGEALKTKAVTNDNQAAQTKNLATDTRVRAANEKELIYVLRVEKFGGQYVLAVEMRRAARRADGSWSKSTAFTPQIRGISLGAMAWGRPEDQEIVRLLLGEFGHFYSHVARLSGEFGTRILHLMMNTGRCYWGQPGRYALELGQPRTGKLAWREMERGKQIATVQVDPSVTAVLPLNPVLYVDVHGTTAETLDSESTTPAATTAEQSGGWVGLLETGVSPEVLRYWLSSPVVLPEQVHAVNEAVTKLDPNLPQLRDIPIDIRKDLEPKGVLQLVGYNVPQQKYPRRWHSYEDQETETEAERIAAVRVLFDYDGLRVPCADRNASFENYSAGRLQRLERNLRVEQRLLRELTRYNLRLLESDYYWLEGEQYASDYTVGDQEEWIEFVTDILPQLKEYGWIVEEDHSFDYRMAEADEWFTDIETSGENWFDLELGVMVDGEKINLLPLLSTILDQLNGPNADLNHITVPLPDGRRLRLPADRLQTIRSTLVELFAGSPLQGGKLRLHKLAAPSVALLGQSDWHWRGSPEVRALGEKLRDFSGIARVDPPAGLTATLRGYQQDGLNWLGFLREFGFGGILADDMGLGKTVQALAHILAEKKAGRANKPSLVIAPTSLMNNWRQEAARFTPELKVLVSHGTARKEHFDQIDQYDLIVTSYALLARDKDILEQHDYHLLILDEAQYIKNARTKYAQVSGQLKARHRICMTGTPLENHLGELWSLMSFLMPGFLGDSKQFRQIFRDPVEKQRDFARLEGLKQRIKPFLLRRRKEDVLKELPPKNNIARIVELTGDQRDLYETIRLAMQRKVRETVNIRGMSRSQIVILDALLKLRQVCCDPRLVKLSMAERVQESAKLEMLMEMVPEMIAEGRKILLFSQFTSMLELIEQRLTTGRIPYVKLTGSTTRREIPVRRFQDGEVPLFLISLKAGGTGLNLTAADTVIHYDPWWNPAVEDQATDRAHRIGQNKVVFVYKLITMGTVEEKIVSLQDKKRTLTEGLLGTTGETGPQFTKEDLEDLFAPLK